MELKSEFINIIKYYLKSKKNKDNKQKFSRYLEKIIILLNQVDINSLDEKSEIYLYLNNIKEFSYKNISNLIKSSLIKNQKIISNNIFDLINEGNIDSITDTENIYKYDIFNKDGMTPLHRCINLGDTTILKEFFKKGEKVDLVNKSGNTLLEYACLQKDPNLIIFLINHGADMKKHLFFRDKIKMKLKINDIDLANIIKICLLEKNKTNNKINIDFLFKFIKPKTTIGINDITFDKFIIYLENLLSSLPIESQQSIISIWKEELDYNLTNNMGCPNNYLELILINLVPFINYPFNITNRNVLTNELIKLIEHLSIKNNFILDNDFNKLLINKIWKDYDEIIPYDYLGVIINHIFSKFKN